MEGNNYEVYQFQEFKCIVLWDLTIKMIMVLINKKNIKVYGGDPYTYLTQSPEIKKSMLDSIFA